MDELTPVPPRGQGLGVMDYSSTRSRRHGAAVGALVLAVVGCVTSPLGVGLFAGVAAIGLAFWARHRIVKEPAVYCGLGMAQVGGSLGVLACVASIVLVPSLNYHGRFPGRSYCAATVRGIMQSMEVYATDNGGMFPVLPYAPYRLNNSDVLSGTVQGATEEDALRSMYGGSGAQDGSPLAGVWVMVLKNYTAPKQYVCKDDPFVKSVAQIGSAGGGWHVNFQSTQQVSYSFAYPYAADGKVGAWWKDTTDSTLPLMSDMAPRSGTGKPRRDVGPGVVPADFKTWNSANHGGSGQNVGFADGHAEFLRRPDVGQGFDNIFTMSGVKGVNEFGGMQPGKSAIGIETEVVPFDVVMVPARDLDGGGF